MLPFPQSPAPPVPLTRLLSLSVRRRALWAVSLLLWVCAVLGGHLRCVAFHHPGHWLQGGLILNAGPAAPYGKPQMVLFGWELP
jgi:hypothetical protein